MMANLMTIWEHLTFCKYGPALYRSPVVIYVCYHHSYPVFTSGCGVLYIFDCFTVTTVTSLFNLFIYYLY